jgi:hypothetical protein
MTTKLIGLAVDSVLKPHKFVRKRFTWNRKAGVFIDVVDVQLSKSRDMVTVNTGVFHREIYARCWSEEPPDFIQEPLCIVRARVGQLIDNEDVWWELTDAHSVEDMKAKIATYVLSYLDKMHSFEAMDQFLTKMGVLKAKYPPPIIYLALLKSTLGDVAGSLEVLENLKTSSKEWNDRIEKIITLIKDRT